jgi:signal transduction histidine kinase
LSCQDEPVTIAARWLARALTWALTPVLVVASSPILLTRPSTAGSLVVPADVPYLVAILVCWSVGVVLTGRVFGQPAGWAFLGLATAMAWSEFVDAYADVALEQRAGMPAGPLAATLGDTSFVWWFVFVALVLQFTPGPPAHGRFRRRLPIVTVAAGFLFQIAALLRSSRLGPPHADVMSPWAIGPLNAPMAVVAAVAVVVTGGCLVASVLWLVQTSRRAEGEPRQQLLWLVAGALPLAPCVIAAFALSFAGYDDFAGYVMSAAIACLAVGAALSVLRYRLYDVERVVTESVAYVIASASVIGVFVIVVVVISMTTPIEAGSALPTVLGTLVGVAAARVSYGWGRRTAGRRINRVRFDAVTAIRAGLTAAGTDLDELVPAALHDPCARVLYPTRGGAWVTSDGREATPRPDAVEVWRRGDVTAKVDFDPDRNSRDVVEAVAREAAAEIDNVALRTELARQVELIGESRSRLATAHLQERRRIERDLHDGAQQRLLALALQLQSARVNGGHDVLRDEVERAVAELGATVQELRDLAAGLQPAALAGGGLLAAVVDLVGRIPLTIGYDVIDRRFPPEVEGAAWFVIAEGVTNAVKHAGVDEVRITVTEQRSVVRVTVCDGGAGGADPAGKGLQGLADRVSALRGTLRVRETSPHGTTLEAELPCAS